MSTKTNETTQEPSTYEMIPRGVNPVVALVLEENWERNKALFEKYEKQLSAQNEKASNTRAVIHPTHYATSLDLLISTISSDESQLWLDYDGSMQYTGYDDSAGHIPRTAIIRIATAFAPTTYPRSVTW